MKKAGWIMTALLLVFVLGASVTPKFLQLQVALDSMANIGWPSKYVLMIGVIELAAMLLFVFPRTAVWGAILFTALLGGAVASKLRVDSPLLSHTLFGVYLGLFAWAALLLREERLRRAFFYGQRDQ